MLRESLEADLRLEQADSGSGIIDSTNSKNAPVLLSVVRPHFLLSPDICNTRNPKLYIYLRSNIFTDVMSCVPIHQRSEGI
jgi:hypothetical protein